MNKQALKRGEIPRLSACFCSTYLTASVFKMERNSETGT